MIKITVRLLTYTLLLLALERNGYSFTPEGVVYRYEGNQIDRIAAEERERGYGGTIDMLYEAAIQSGNFVPPYNESNVQNYEEIPTIPKRNFDAWKDTLQGKTIVVFAENKREAPGRFFAKGYCVVDVQNEGRNSVAFIEQVIVNPHATAAETMTWDLLFATGRLIPTDKVSIVIDSSSRDHVSFLNAVGFRKKPEKPNSGNTGSHRLYQASPEQIAEKYPYEHTAWGNKNAKGEYFFTRVNIKWPSKHGNENNAQTPPTGKDSRWRGAAKYPGATVDFWEKNLTGVFGLVTFPLATCAYLTAKLLNSDR
jgi:hypothetical protein